MPYYLCYISSRSKWKIIIVLPLICLLWILLSFLPITLWKHNVTVAMPSLTIERCLIYQYHPYFSIQVHLRSAKRILKLCEINQGFYIKAGQFVASMRQVPKEYSSTLASLQDQVLITCYCAKTILYCVKTKNRGLLSLFNNIILKIIKLLCTI